MENSVNKQVNSCTAFASSITVVIASRFNEQSQYGILGLVREISKSGVSSFIVCAPKLASTTITELSSIPKLKIVRSDFTGQSLQRALALTQVSTSYVLQLDDDIEIDHLTFSDFLKSIATFITNDNRIIVAPILASSNKVSLYTSDSNFFGSIKRFIRWLIFGIPQAPHLYQGKIFFPGAAISILPSNFNSFTPDQTFVQTSWLPGGFVIYHSNYILPFAPFPFYGKAYSEDCLSSFHWQKRNAKLFVCTKFIFRTKIESMSFSGTVANFINAVPAMFFYDYLARSFTLRSILLYPMLMFMYIALFFVKRLRDLEN